MTNVVLTVKLDGRIQEESLLHTSQRREAAMQMRNIRLMCSGGGRLVCSITDLNRELTRRMLAVSVIQFVPKCHALIERLRSHRPVRILLAESVMLGGETLKVSMRAGLENIPRSVP